MKCMDLVEDLLITITTMGVGWLGVQTSNTMESIITIISDLIWEWKQDGYRHILYLLNHIKVKHARARYLYIYSRVVLLCYLHALIPR